MGIIKQLDYETAVLVAAGEMIERPSSIVKELVENSIDAGATKVTVEIQNGGISLIRCSDNGCGIAKEDLPMAIKRNATSKIFTSDDLAAIMTLGFRGEALASIAAVADLRIRSKRKCDEVGAELEIHPGMDMPTLIDAPMADGTTIIVENLFANIPARRKFLKKDSTEASYISDLFEHLALSNPNVAMTLIVDGKMRYSTAGDGNLKHTIYSIYGAEFTSKLIELDWGNDVKIYGGGSVNIKIKGFISTPSNTHGTRRNQIFFINGRNVRSRCLQSALEQSFTSYMEASRFPACIMFVDVPPQFVDVNIHPTKLEVKFVSDKPVFEAVYYAVRGALERHIPRPKLELSGKDTGEVSYEMMKHLNSFTPIEERPETKEPRPVYNNQRNVKEGQISYIDVQLEQAVPEPFYAPIANQEMQKPENTVEYRMEQVQTPSNDGSCQQEVYLEEIPQRLEREMSAEGGMPVKPQNMYLGEVAPEVESALSSPKVKCIQPDKRPSRMTGEEFDAMRKTFEESRGIMNTQFTLPDVPDPEEVRLAKNTAVPPPKRIPEYKIIGEAFLSYVFVEVYDKVLVIDKHAAHERIIFEDLKANLMNRLNSGEVPMQMLLVPIEIQLGAGLIDTIAEYEDDIRAVGFDFILSSNRTVEITSIPAELSQDAARDVFETIAERLCDGTGSAAITRDTLFEKALYQASCKAAIKIGREYDMGHIKWICDKLLVLDDIKVCPHGRPVAIEMSKSSIERQFKRI